MDMKINKETLRRERELRAWTQSHLAEVADLSMRTVQRIERTGDASMESASALAAALNLDLIALMEKPVSTDQTNALESRSYPIWGLLGLIGSAAIALGWWSNATAEQVMISLAIGAGENIHSDMVLLHEIGKESEMNLDDKFRMTFNTRRQDEGLLLSAHIYNLKDGGNQLISSPAILVKDQTPALMRIGLEDGNEINLQLVADF